MKLFVDTKDGRYTAHYTRRGLAQLDFPLDERPCEFDEADGDVSAAEAKRWHKLTCEALNSILTGKSPSELPPLDLSVGSEFQQSVWKALLQIELGRTKSYAEVATAIRKPKAVRAVGGACGANPIPVIVPCHRVLAANQKLGGFTSGLKRKVKLLAAEGVLLG